MAFVGIRALSREVSKTLEQLEQDREPVIITNHGRPVAALVAVDQHNLEDLVLAATPEAARRRSAAEEAIAAGAGIELEPPPSQADSPAADQSPGGTEDVLALLRPVHSRVLGWEPSDEVLAGAARTVGETVSAAIQTLGPDQDSDAAQRVRNMCVALYTRLWAHSFRDAVDDRLIEMTREAPRTGLSFADEGVVQVAAETAAEQLRDINRPLVELGIPSIQFFEACFTALAQFDDLAHQEHSHREEHSQRDQPVEA